MFNLFLKCGIPVNKDYAKALDEMRKEAWKSHQRGESFRLRDLK